MSSERVVAVSSNIQEVGKRMSDSKKRFLWQFRISDNTYTMVLVSSALSGKRIVTLNDVEIYSEKNVLNMNFDFIHNIEGHSIRIYKESESVNNFGCRIDNRSFDYLLKKASTGSTNVEKKSSKYAASDNDPFSEFSSFASKKPVESKNEFGDFDDFGSFDFAKPAKSQSPTQKVAVTQKPKENIDFFDFGGEKKETVQAENFQTNNFEKRFQEVDLLGGADEGEFATNTYGQYNNYLDLMAPDQGVSDTWGTEDPNKKKTLRDQVRPDITAKQAKNKTLMTAVELKKKAVDLLDL